MAPQRSATQGHRFCRTACRSMWHRERKHKALLRVRTLLALVQKDLENESPDALKVALSSIREARAQLAVGMGEPG